MPPQIQLFGHVTLTESVNKIVTPKTFIRDTVFAKRTVTAPTTTIMVDIIIGGRKLAPFVKRGDPAKVVELTGKKTSFVEPPSIGMLKILTAKDLLYDRAPGTTLVLGGNDAAAIQTARQERIGLEQKDMVMRSDRTEEYMSCQAIATGGFNYKDADTEFEIDFNMPAANKPVLAGAFKWNASATCTPIDDLAKWKLIVKKSCGKIPTRVIMGTDVWQLFLASKQVQDYLNRLKINIGSIDTTSDILLMGAEKKARIDNMDFYTYDEYYDGGNGMVSMIPTDRIIMIADAGDYRMNYGAIENLEAGSAIGKYFSNDFFTKNPSVYNLMVEGHPLPTVNEPDAIISAKVV